MAHPAASVTAPVTSDAASFAGWLRPSWATLHRYAVRLAGPGQADDVLQDALAVAWRKRQQFDPARGTARAWLLAIVRDQARKTRRRALRARAELVPVADLGPAPHRVDVARALARLTERQREVVGLYYYLDLPVDEVAQVLGCSSGTVKSTLSDARRRLGEILGADY